MRTDGLGLLLRTADGRQFRFTQTFSVGRSADCDVCIDDSHVSRKHVSVEFDRGHWCVRDLQSSNGIFVNNKRVQTVQIDKPLTVRLGGADGPCAGAAAGRSCGSKRCAHQSRPARRRCLRIMWTGTSARKAPMSRLDRERCSFGRRSRTCKGSRSAVSCWILATMTVVAVALAGYAYYGHRQIRQQQALAEELFYTMKSLDVDIANVERVVEASGNPKNQDQVRSYLERRREFENSYDKFLSGLKLYGGDLTEEERLILRVTRMFGECELVAPREYLAEVGRYIKRWQSTQRYVRGIKLAQEKGYIRRIAEEFITHNLPPQFIYLAMQESDFDPFNAGPPTPYGHAKGMWQFIPETGERYGLAVGPLVKFRRPDPADDRSNWQKATVAAARYIKEIYATDAQASGLLVMASYNWGEGRVIKRLKQMPANPRERNFWKLLERYRNDVPDQTYRLCLLHCLSGCHWREPSIVRVSV